MEFEWDETKRRANLQKHGLDFADALAFEWETARVTIDDRFDYGEEREIALGFYRGHIHVVVFTDCGTTRRIISFRKATSHEAKIYEEEKNRS